MTLAALRPSDLLLLALFVGQIFYFPRISTEFLIVKYFGLFNLLILCLGMVGLSLFSNVDVRFNSMFMLYYYFRFYMIFQVVYHVIKENGVFEGYRFYSAAIIIVFFISWIQFAAIDPVSGLTLNLYQENTKLDIYETINDSIRVVGVVGNANGLGVLLASFVCLLIALRIIEGRKSLLQVLAILILLMLIVVFTGSRTAMFSVILFAGVVLIDFSSIKRIAFLVFGSALFVWLISTYLSQSQLVSSRITSIFSAGNSADQLEQFAPRVLLWYDRFQKYESISNPLKFWFGLSYGVEELTYSDNGFINSFFNVGVFGLVLRGTLFFFLLFQPYWILRKLEKKPEDNFLKSAFAFSSICFPLIFFDLTGDAIEYYRLAQVMFVFASISAVSVLVSKKDGKNHICS
jgi:hypothetical protein